MINTGWADWVQGESYSGIWSLQTQSAAGGVEEPAGAADQGEEGVAAAQGGPGQGHQQQAGPDEQDAGRPGAGAQGCGGAEEQTVQKAGGTPGPGFWDRDQHDCDWSTQPPADQSGASIRDGGEEGGVSTWSRVEEDDSVRVSGSRSWCC